MSETEIEKTAPRILSEKNKLLLRDKKSTASEQMLNPHDKNTYIESKTLDEIARGVNANPNDGTKLGADTSSSLEKRDPFEKLKSRAVPSAETGVIADTDVLIKGTPPEKADDDVTQTETGQESLTPVRDSKGVEASGPDGAGDNIQDVASDVGVKVLDNKTTTQTSQPTLADSSQRTNVNTGEFSYPPPPGVVRLREEINRRRREQQGASRSGGSPRSSATEGRLQPASSVDTSYTDAPGTNRSEAIPPGGPQVVRQSIDNLTTTSPATDFLKSSIKKVSGLFGRGSQEIPLRQRVQTETQLLKEQKDRIRAAVAEMKQMEHALTEAMLSSGLIAETKVTALGKQIKAFVLTEHANAILRDAQARIESGKFSDAISIPLSRIELRNEPLASTARIVFSQGGSINQPTHKEFTFTLDRPAKTSLHTARAFDSRAKHTSSVRFQEGQTPSSDFSAQWQSIKPIMLEGRGVLDTIPKPANK